LKGVINGIYCVVSFTADLNCLRIRAGLLVDPEKSLKNRAEEVEKEQMGLIADARKKGWEPH